MIKLSHAITFSILSVTHIKLLLEIILESLTADVNGCGPFTCLG